MQYMKMMWPGPPLPANMANMTKGLMPVCMHDFPIYAKENSSLLSIAGLTPFCSRCKFVDLLFGGILS